MTTKLLHVGNPAKSPACQCQRQNLILEKYRYQPRKNFNGALQESPKNPARDGEEIRTSALVFLFFFGNNTRKNALCQKQHRCHYPLGALSNKATRGGEEVLRRKNSII